MSGHNSMRDLITQLRIALIKQGIKPYALVLGYEQQARLKKEADLMQWVWPSPYKDDPCTFDGLVIIDSMTKSELRVLPYAT